VKRGNLGEARRHLQQALAIDPNYAPAIQALRAIGAQGE
jgi:Tfp pilus assembly protein PilF